MNNIILTKSSQNTEIKMYFEKVLELSRGSSDFPINLDEVWMLVYAEKGTAARTLKRNFIENEDFVMLDQNVKRSRRQSEGGANKIDYFLSISCLEYFIARKARPVFEVYRKVFHKVATSKPLSQLEIMKQSVTLLMEQDARISNVENEVKVLQATSQTRPDFFTVVGYGTLNGYKVNLSLASRIGQKASRKCKDLGIQTDSIPDPRFGKVKMYPSEVLKDVFNETI